jgi:peroxin-13
MYGRSYGGYGSGYGLGAYGGGGTYGSGYGGAGMYGSGYGGMYGRPMYGGGGGMYGGGYAPMGPPWDPNDPNAPAPPSAWQAMLAGISGIVHFFGRLSFLVDENAHAVHFFISALLQLLDRFGSLYGELARFVLRMLGFRPKDKMAAGPGHQGQGANFSPIGGGHGPTTSSSGLPFDKVWGSSGKKIS